jgi:hypothetical protein
MHNKNPVGESNLYNFYQRKTTQKSRSWKWFQEVGSDFKKQFRA